MTEKPGNPTRSENLALRKYRHVLSAWGRIAKSCWGSWKWGGMPDLLTWINAERHRSGLFPLSREAKTQWGVSNADYCAAVCGRGGE